MSAPINLAFGAAGATRITLGALTGADERAGSSADRLLDRLSVAGPGLVHGEQLSLLTVGDRDRALAGLYRHLYSDTIDADATCTACSKRFELSFSLSALVGSHQPSGGASGDPPSIAIGSSRLRLPRHSDILGSPEECVTKLTISGPAPSVEQASEALEEADPTLDFDLLGSCPECKEQQKIPFAIAAFLESALRRDAVFLAREVHLIATGYGWPLGEILSLRRDERQEFARLLIAERETATPLRRAS